MAEGDGEKERLCLYLFKTHARSKMLAFRRLSGPEFPMRMLPLDYYFENDEDEQLGSGGGGTNASQRKSISSS